MYPMKCLFRPLIEVYVGHGSLKTWPLREQRSAGGLRKVAVLNRNEYIISVDEATLGLSLVAHFFDKHCRLIRLYSAHVL
jgi:hypothetical protein